MCSPRRSPPGSPEKNHCTRSYSPREIGVTNSHFPRSLRRTLRIRSCRHRVAVGRVAATVVGSHPVVVQGIGLEPRIDIVLHIGTHLRDLAEARAIGRPFNPEARLVRGIVRPGQRDLALRVDRGREIARRRRHTADLDGVAGLGVVVLRRATGIAFRHQPRVIGNGAQVIGPGHERGR